MATGLQANTPRAKCYLMRLVLEPCHIFNDVEPIEIKSHGDRAKSIFRHGYDYLRRLIINIRDRADEFFENLSVIMDGKGAHKALKNIIRA